MSKCFIPFLAAVVCAPFLAAAQEPSPTPDPDAPPTAPFVARASEFAAWSIDVTPKKGAPAPTPTPVPVLSGPGRTAPPELPAPPRKVLRNSLVTKTGNIIRDIRTFNDGTKTENWWIHGRIMRQDPRDGHINIIDPNIDRSASQFNSSDFEALSWIELSHFVRSENRRGVKCYLYEWKERMPTADEFDKLTDYGAKSALYHKFEGKPTLPTQAWIAKESRLPVSSEDESATYQYSYLKPPTEPLKLPESFQKEWDFYQATLDDWKTHVMPKQK